MVNLVLERTLNHEDTEIKLGILDIQEFTTMSHLHRNIPFKQL